MDFPRVSTTIYYDSDGDVEMLDRPYPAVPPDLESSFMSYFFRAYQGTEALKLELEVNGYRQWTYALNMAVNYAEAELASTHDRKDLQRRLAALEETRDVVLKHRICLERSLAWIRGEDWYLEAFLCLDGIE